MRKPTKTLIRNGPWAQPESGIHNILGFRNQIFHRCVLPLVEIFDNYVVLRSDMFQTTYRLR